MSIIMMDGFDDYGLAGTNAWPEISWKCQHQNGKNAVGTASNIQNGHYIQEGRYNGKSISIDGGSYFRSPDTWTALSIGDKLIVGFNFYTGNHASSNINFYPGGSAGGKIGFNTAHIDIWRQSNSGGSTIDEGDFVPPVWNVNSWYNIEVVIEKTEAHKFSLILYVDEAIIYESTTDWSNMSNSGLPYVQISGDYTSNPCRIDDFYIFNSLGAINNVRIGKDARVETLFPSGTVTETWDLNNNAGATNHLECVDGSGTYDINNFIYTDTSSETEEFLFQDLTNIVYPLATQINTLDMSEVNEKLYHTVNNVVESGYTVVAGEDVVRYHRMTKFDEGTLSVANINAINAGVKSSDV